MKNLALPLALLIMVLVSGCSPQSKLRRAKRLIAEAENSGLEWKSDTVFREIKIVVPETKFDTVLKAVNFRDTLIITKHDVVTRIKINTVTRDVFVDTKCPEKIVIKKVPYTVSREIRVGDSWWKKLSLSFFWLIIGAGAMWVLVRFRILR
jgi:hypothetical protein